MPLLSPSPTKLHRNSDGRWQLLRNDRPFFTQGAGGGRRFDLLKKLGGNTVRTWHTNSFEELDRAHAYGLAVMAGLSVEHERHGFDYGDRSRVESQRIRILDTVRRLKDHPALLIWGLGNETEGFERPDGHPGVWRELDRLARMIKAEDPDHPVCTVIAGPRMEKLSSFKQYCPHVDILGINAYGEALDTPGALTRAGLEIPFLLTEFGPTGHWETRLTPWGAPVEPSGPEKARVYLDTHREILRRSGGQCLGTLAFLWGQKQEVTPTWYGMFLATGEKTAAVDAMALAWSGIEPEHRSPTITRLSSSLAESVIPSASEHEVLADVDQGSEGDLRFDWHVMAESTDRGIGGDPERMPPEIPGCVTRKAFCQAVVRAPEKSGAYRLFLYVRDSQGAGATANIPFFVTG